MREDDGVLPTGTIQAIDVVGPMMAVMGDRESIREIAAAVEDVERLEEWSGLGEWVLQEADLVDRILDAVAKNPGIKQSKLKAATGAQDGWRSSTLARWIEDANRLVRVQVGSTYQLHPEGTRLSRPEPRADTELGAGLCRAALVAGNDQANKQLALRLCRFLLHACGVRDKESGDSDAAQAPR